MKLSPAMTAKILAMASGETPKDKPKRLCGRKPVLWKSSWSITVSVPTAIVSEANTRQHWSKKERRKNEQRSAVGIAFFHTPFRTPCPLPVAVTLTHIGQKMDDDNLANGFKGIRDYIASVLLGVDDGDSRVTWKYDQRAGRPGVEVRIEFGMEAA